MTGLASGYADLFHLNVVGYKAERREFFAEFLVEFHLNVVGYKAEYAVCTFECAGEFHLNVVGYKDKPENRAGLSIIGFI